jgi:hypothetical protein
VSEYFSKVNDWLVHQKGVLMNATTCFRSVGRQHAFLYTMMDFFPVICTDVIFFPNVQLRVNDGWFWAVIYTNKVLLKVPAYLYIDEL